MSQGIRICWTMRSSGGERYKDSVPLKGRGGIPQDRHTGMERQEEDSRRLHMARK